MWYCIKVLNIFRSMPVAVDGGLDDIEDIVSKATDLHDIRHENRKHVVPKAKRFTKSSTVASETVQADSLIPGITHCPKPMLDYVHVHGFLGISIVFAHADVTRMK